MHFLWQTNTSSYNSDKHHYPFFTVSRLLYSEEVLSANPKVVMRILGLSVACYVVFRVSYYSSHDVALAHTVKQLGYFCSDFPPTPFGTCFCSTWSHRGT